MESEVALDSANDEKPLPCSKKLEEANDVSEPITTTPDPERETASLVVSSSPENVVDPTQTPADGVFDPFGSPGPGNLMLDNAPLLCWKFSSRGELQKVNVVVRRLNFDDLSARTDDVGSQGGGMSCESTGVDDDGEMLLLESVYDTLLEAIVLKQSEGLLLEQTTSSTTNSTLDLCTDGDGDGHDDGLKTPDSAKRLTGVADTCPHAPEKSSYRKSRNIDQSLCRKLEF